jgi:hypothetical protein
MFLMLSVYVALMALLSHKERHSHTFECKNLNLESNDMRFVVDVVFPECLKNSFTSR